MLGNLSLPAKATTATAAVNISNSGTRFWYTPA
jgi:hypothetical protein